MGIHYVNFILTDRAGSPRYFGFSSDDYLLSNANHLSCPHVLSAVLEFRILEVY